MYSVIVDGDDGFVANVLLTAPPFGTQRVVLVPIADYTDIAPLVPGEGESHGNDESLIGHDNDSVEQPQKRILMAQNVFILMQVMIRPCQFIYCQSQILCQ